MKTLQENLYNLSEACRLGAKIPVTISLDEKMLNEQLHGAVKANLPIFDRAYMDKCEKAYAQGFEASIVGKFELSRKAFAAAESVLESKPLFYESRLLIKVFLRAAQAYLDYSLKDFDLAKARLLEAIQCDEILETQFGYGILHIHRVHLVENIMRLEFQAGHKHEAFKLGHGLLFYLAGIAPALPIPGGWGQELLSKVTPEVVRSKFIGITTDVAQFLAPMNPDAAREFVCAASTFDTASKQYCPSEAIEWFAIKEAFSSERYLDFLSLASAFLAMGPRAAPGLWSAVALDAVGVCEVFPEAEAIRKEILAGAMDWGFMPRKLKALFVSKAADLQVKHGSASI